MGLSHCKPSSQETCHHFPILAFWHSLWFGTLLKGLRRTSRAVRVSSQQRAAASGAGTCVYWDAASVRALAWVDACECFSGIRFTTMTAALWNGELHWLSHGQGRNLGTGRSDDLVCAWVTRGAEATPWAPCHGFIFISYSVGRLCVRTPPSGRFKEVWVWGWFPHVWQPLFCPLPAKEITSVSERKHSWLIFPTQHPLVSSSWLLPTDGSISVPAFKWICGGVSVWRTLWLGGGIPQIPILGSCREVLAVLAWPVGCPTAHVHSELHACCVSCKQLELLLFQTVL